MRSIGRLIILSLALIIWAIPSPLLGQVTGGEIVGTITDESGAVLPGGSVTVRNLDTGLTRNVVAMDSGRYRVPNLPIGTYEVQAELSGFRTAIRRGIQLTVGRGATVDLTLAVGEVTEDIVVTGDAPLVETRTSGLGGLVGEQQMQDLPLNARNFVQLTLLETGVAHVRTAGTGAATGAGLRMSVHGARMEHNNYMMDGTSMNSVNQAGIGGASEQAMGAETIKEFQVLTSNFSAEFGRAGGGVINVVTKSGTNTLNGSAFAFHRNEHMEAHNYFDPKDRVLPEFKRNQFGVTVGGPIRRNRTFFFGGYEGLRETLGTTMTGTVPTMAARDGNLPSGRIAVDPRVVPYLALYPAPNGRDFGDGRAEFIRQDSQIVSQNFFQGRLDQILSDADSVFVRYTRDYSQADSPQTLGNNLLNDLVRTQLLTAEYQKIVSPRFLNVFRFGFNDSYVNYTSTNLDPRIDDRSLWFVPDAVTEGFILGVSGLTSVGGISNRPRFRGDNVYQFTNTATYNSGAHTLKIGGEYQRILTDEEEVFRGQGNFSFTNLTNFLRAQPNNFQGVTATSDFKRSWKQHLMGVFLQDDLQLHDDLTLNLGVRWEFVTDPIERDGKASHMNSPLDTETIVGNPMVRTPKRNIAPRLGFAWAPWGNTKTSLRGGFGVFHPMIFRVYYRVARHQPPFIVDIAGEGPNLLFPHPLEGTTRRPLPAPRVMDYEFDNPEIWQYNLTLQRELMPTTVVTVGYVGSRGRNDAILTDPNIAVPQVLSDGRKFYPAGSVRRNSAFADMNWLSMDSDSTYNALELKLTHRLRRGLQFQAAYTLSKSLDTASVLFTGGASNSSTFPQDPFDRDSDRGQSAFDVRQVAVVNFTYALPGERALLKGWQVTGIATFNAGHAFSVSNSFDRDRDGSTGASRPDLASGASDNPVLGGPDRYFDPTAFVLQEAGFYGNVGRNTLIGPGQAMIDFAIIKNTSLGGGRNLQLRAEGFNLLNRANFNLPSAVVFRSAAGVHEPTAGRITSTSTTARQFQLGMRFTF
ncbi:MAG: TonB-dependent receptor domain-containing protein [Vicinamibacterales bacterium]